MYAAPNPMPGKRLKALAPMPSVAACLNMARLRLVIVWAGEASVMTLASLYIIIDHRDREY